MQRCTDCSFFSGCLLGASVSNASAWCIHKLNMVHHKNDTRSLENTETEGFMAFRFFLFQFLCQPCKQKGGSMRLASSSALSCRMVSASPSAAILPWDRRITRWQVSKIISRSWEAMSLVCGRPPTVICPSPLSRPSSSLGDFRCLPAETGADRGCALC